MTSPITSAEFDAILDDELGFNITRQARTASGTDAIGETTYALGSPDTIKAIVQDVTTHELKAAPGILEVGDKHLYVKSTITLAPTDVLTIDSIKWQIIDAEVPKLGTPTLNPFKHHLIRRTKG